MSVISQHEDFNNLEDWTQKKSHLKRQTDLQTEPETWGGGRLRDEQTRRILGTAQLGTAGQAASSWRQEELRGFNCTCQGLFQYSLKLGLLYSM